MRNPEKTRSQILDAAYHVVYRNGFRASSVNDIMAKTGVTQGAFFHYFPTKSDLGYALVDEVLKEMTFDRWTRPLAAYKNPLQGIVSRFRILMEALSDEDMALGCPLNNLSQEMSTVDPVFREKINAVLRSWVDETERYLRLAKARGYLKSDVNPRQAAEFIVMAEEGAAGMVKNFRDRRVYWSLYETFRRFILSISEPVKAHPT